MIEVRDICRRFDGRQALDGFSLHVSAGELFGLVGPNDAGKTTLMRVLSTLLRPDGGQALIGDLDLTKQPHEVKRLIDYMSDQPGVYQDMSVREFLEFFADAFQLTGARHRAAVEHESVAPSQS